MEIRFTGEDEHGNSVVYDSWRELAEAEPYAVIDADTFSPAQLQYLADDLAQHVELGRVKSGDEEVDLPPSPYDSNLPPIIRFAVVNFPRVQPEPDYLMMAESEAASYLAHTLGGFHGPNRTFVCKNVKQEWKLVELETGKPKTCERLVDLFHLDLAPRLSRLWHAVRIFALSEMAQKTIDTGDARAALTIGIVIGESRKALAMQTLKVEQGASKGASEKIAKQDAKIQAEADRQAVLHPRHAKNKSWLATEVLKNLDLNLSHRTVRDKINISGSGG
jgi:hypothetical protein